MPTWNSNFVILPASENKVHQFFLKLIEFQRDDSINTAKELIDLVHTPAQQWHDYIQSVGSDFQLDAFLSKTLDSISRLGFFSNKSRGPRSSFAELLKLTDDTDIKEEKSLPGFTIRTYESKPANSDKAAEVERILKNTISVISGYNGISIIPPQCLQSFDSIGINFLEDVNILPELIVALSKVTYRDILLDHIYFLLSTEYNAHMPHETLCRLTGLTAVYFGAIDQEYESSYASYQEYLVDTVNRSLTAMEKPNNLINHQTRK